MKKPKSKIDFAKILIAVAVVVGISMVVKSLMLQPVISLNKEKAEELTVQIKEEKHHIEEIDKIMKQAGSDEYIERIAREKLGMIKADEIVFIDISGQQ